MLSCLLAFGSCKRPTPELPAEVPVGEEQTTEDSTFLKDIDPATAGELMLETSPPVVLDVRTAEEFADGHLEGAINIDFNGSGFRDQIAELDAAQTYLLHCRSGARSSQAKVILTGLGFSAVYHLDGGIMAWEKAGLPTVK